MMFSAVINELCKFGLHLKSHIHVSFQLCASTKISSIFNIDYTSLLLLMETVAVPLLFCQCCCSVFPRLSCDYVLFSSTCTHICSSLPPTGLAFVLQCTIELRAPCFRCKSCAVVLFSNIFLKCVNCSSLTQWRSSPTCQMAEPSGFDITVQREVLLFVFSSCYFFVFPRMCHGFLSFRGLHQIARKLNL